MSNVTQTTLSRDLSVLLHRRGFWWLSAVWALLSGLLFFALLEDFLSVQPTLRAKQTHYGVTDLVIIPYLKTLGFIAAIFMASLCSRLFYLECFSPFSALYRTLNNSAFALVLAKLLYVLILALWALMLPALPLIVCGYFFDYNVGRVLMMLLALLVFLLSVGMIAMVWSQLISHSIVVVLLTMVPIGALELLVKWVVEPTWVVPIVAFFSPVTHVNRMATGVVSLSDGVFFILLMFGLMVLALRQFNNTYFITR